MDYIQIMPRFFVINWLFTQNDRLLSTYDRRHKYILHLSTSTRQITQENTTPLNINIEETTSENLKKSRHHTMAKRKKQN